LKISFKKGYRIYASHIEETMKDKDPNLKYYLVLKEYEYLFEELPRLQPKRDIYFSIDLIPRVSPVSKTPYRMSTPKLKEFQM
jgi:hypothetical protein